MHADIEQRASNTPSNYLHDVNVSMSLAPTASNAPLGFNDTRLLRYCTLCCCKNGVCTNWFVPTRTGCPTGVEAATAPRNCSTVAEILEYLNDTTLLTILNETGLLPNISDPAFRGTLLAPSGR